MALTRAEWETHIWIDGLTLEVKIEATDPRYIHKLDKLCKENPDTWKATGDETINGEVVGRFYSCPVNCIGFKSGKKREYTEEQKEAARERFRKNVLKS